MSIWSLMSFGPDGWGLAMLAAAGVTLVVAICGFALGSVLGALIAWVKLSGGIVPRAAADTYTTILRGIPDLLIIYLLYFGGSTLLSRIAAIFGSGGFVGVSGFAAGATAIGVISAAYQSEVFRGAYTALNRGEIEAAKSMGMHRALMFRRIIAPQVLRYAIPGLGNVWQLALKESSLISVTGLVELLRQSAVGAGSTGEPFLFYLAAALLYLAITSVSSWGFRSAERHSMRGVGRA